VINVNLIRRCAKVALLALLASSLSGCIVVPLRGWGHEHHGGHGYGAPERGEGPRDGGDHRHGR